MSCKKLDKYSCEKEAERIIQELVYYTDLLFYEYKDNLEIDVLVLCIKQINKDIVSFDTLYNECSNYEEMAEEIRLHVNLLSSAYNEEITQ